MQLGTQVCDLVGRPTPGHGAPLAARTLRLVGKPLQKVHPRPCLLLRLGLVAGEDVARFGLVGYGGVVLSRLGAVGRPRLVRSRARVRGGGRLRRGLRVRARLEPTGRAHLAQSTRRDLDALRHEPRHHGAPAAPLPLRCRPTLGLHGWQGRVALASVWRSAGRRTAWRVCRPSPVGGRGCVAWCDLVARDDAQLVDERGGVRVDTL